MSGVLVMLGLVVAVLAVFVQLFRRRVRKALQRSGHEVPAELKPAGGAVVARPAAGPEKPVSLRAVPPPRLHFLLIYDLDRDFVQRRTEHWDEHLALAWKASAAGELVLAGALEPPAEQAFLLFRGSREAAIRFAEADPYVRHGLVKQWRVKQWHTVAGEGAAAPVRPK